MSTTINEIKELDREKIIRPKYGETSLTNWENVFDEMLNKFDFIQKYWSKVDTKTNQQVQNSLNTVFQHLKQLTNFNDSQFVSNKQSSTNQIDRAFNEIKPYWPQYAIVAIEESGLLDNIDVKKEFESLTNNLKVSTENALKQIEKESKTIIAQAQNKANEIENSVRKTAQKISVQEAQDQFGNAASNNKKNINIWGGITLLFISTFIILIIIMMNIELPELWSWKVIYFSILRIAIIGFIGTLLAFSLKILKSHLHMREHNLHRQRIANSMASFAESATNQEQRDIILTRLVDSVATFGNSGMINNDEEGNSKITVDNISRTLGALKNNPN